jgi:hypothetical protein
VGLLVAMVGDVEGLTVGAEVVTVGVLVGLAVGSCVGKVGAREGEFEGEVVVIVGEEVGFAVVGVDDGETVGLAEGETVVVVGVDDGETVCAVGALEVGAAVGVAVSSINTSRVVLTTYCVPPP